MDVFVCLQEVDLLEEKWALWAASLNAREVMYELALEAYVTSITNTGDVCPERMSSRRYIFLILPTKCCLIHLLQIRVGKCQEHYFLYKTTTYASALWRVEPPFRTCIYYVN